MILPFFSDKPIPLFSLTMTARVSPHQQAFVYPMENFPSPMPLAMGSLIVPVEIDAMMYSYLTGECKLQFFPMRTTSKRVMDALTAVIALQDVSTAPPNEKPIVAFLRGFLWFIDEASARELGAKPYKEWKDIIRKSDHDARHPDKQKPVLSIESIRSMSTDDQLTYCDWFNGEYPRRVNIVDSSDRGKIEHGVTIAGDTEFWIDAFETRESAVEFCVAHDLQIEEVSK